MKKVVLGIEIDDINKQEALRKVSDWVEKDNGRPKIVATVGPEFLVTASKNGKFFEALNQFDLALPEGFGLQLYTLVQNRVPGVDFVWELLRLANEKGWRVGLLGGISGVAQKAAAKMTERFVDLKIFWAIDGSAADKFLMQPDLLASQPDVDLMLVAFGHPKQELFLQVAKEKAGKSFSVGIGVGGSLDYISGVKPWFPRFLAPIGLEWLGRLLVNPGHFVRVWRATIVFPWLLFWSRFRWG